MRDALLAFGPLLGVIVGGLIAWLNSRSQAARQEIRERKQLIRGKLEDLHQLVADFIEYYRCLTFTHVRDPNKLRRVSSSTVDLVPFDRIEMLVGIYAPELSVYVKTIARITGEYSVPFTKLLGDEEWSETEKASLRSSVAKLSFELVETCAQMQQEIIAVSKNYV